MNIVMTRQQRAVILTDSELATLKQDKDAQVAVTRHESQERKRRMLDKELEVRARREQSAMEMELEAERRAPLTGDEALFHPHLESLRKISSLALQATGYLKCDQLRERQKGRQAMEDKYNLVHDSIMERDRIAELQQRREDQEVARTKRVEAREMLEHQIAERQKKAIWEEEAKAIEAQKILNTYKQYEAEERGKLEQHREHKKIVAQQVADTNDSIKRMKLAAVAREKQEEMVAAAYLRKKAQEEEAHMQEQMRLRKAKELRVAKLRAQQEKAQDKQAELDEFRAKRAFEETEKKARLKEKHDRETKSALMQSIDADRKRQEAFRAENRLRERQLDAHMDLIGLQHVDQEYHERKAAEEAAKAEALKHGELVRQQIAGNEQRRQKARMFEANDAKFLIKKNKKESILAEKVRRDTLLRLQKEGVPEEYLRGLARMTIDETNA